MTLIKVHSERLMLMHIKRKDIKMRTIEKLEKAKNIDKCLKDQGINSTFFYAYERTLETTNENINFSDVI